MYLANATTNAEPSNVRVVNKIAEMASDAVECSEIAKRVAMKITEGLTDGDIVTRNPREDVQPGRVSSLPIAAGL